jgi:hypothetical protein
MGKRGRPQKEHADWYSHRTNFRNEGEVRALRATFGSQGYGILIMIWEKLASSPNFRFNYSSHRDKATLSGDLIEPIEMLDKVIEFLEEFGLLQRHEDGSIYSPGLLVELDQLIKDRKADAERKREEKEKQDAGSNREIPDGDIFHPEKELFHPEKSNIHPESPHSNSNSNSNNINISNDNVKPMYPKGFVHEQFERCWIAYGKKGTKNKAFSYWEKLSQPDRDAIEKKIPQYVASTSEIKYRKHFDGWINPTNRMWENEIISTNPSSLKVGDTNQNGYSKGKF